MYAHEKVSVQPQTDYIKMAKTLRAFSLAWVGNSEKTLSCHSNKLIVMLVAALCLECYSSVDKLQT